MGFYAPIISLDGKNNCGLAYTFPNNLLLLILIRKQDIQRWVQLKHLRENFSEYLAFKTLREINCKDILKENFYEIFLSQKCLAKNLGENHQWWKVKGFNLSIRFAKTIVQLFFGTIGLVQLNQHREELYFLSIVFFVFKA